MHKPTLTKAAKLFQGFFDPQHLQELANRSGFSQRVRKITAGDFISNLVTTMGQGKVNTIAELHQNYVRNSGVPINYKPFHDRLNQPGFPALMGELARMCFEKMRISTLASNGSPLFNGFEDIILHDGSSFGLRNGLQETFPGRFSKHTPAAVELHVSMSLFTGNITTVQITPDKESERNYAPLPESMTNKLVLMDRGYDGIPYLKTIHEADGHFICRTRKLHDPEVTFIVNNPNVLCKSKANILSGVLLKLSNQKVHDLDVTYNTKDGTFQGRLILSWSKKEKTWMRLVTNLSRSRVGKKQIIQSYRLRWQIELLFKECKSFNSLGKFQTNSPHIATGLIWAALIATFLKRILGHICQIALYGADISSQKVSKDKRLLLILSQAMTAGLDQIIRCLTDIVEHARKNLRSSRLEREMKTGKLALGVVLTA